MTQSATKTDLPRTMNADDFATRLASLAPAAPALIAANRVSESVAEQFRARYFCPRITRSDESDTLLDICNNFDLSSMKIGAVKLQRPSEFDRNYVKLGFFESDTIVYPKAGGIVSVRDHED